jgi:hypothetical protein
MGQERIKDTVDRIKRSFPDVEVNVTFDHPELDGVIDIPEQSNLAFPLHINLQNNDEFHLQVSGLWASWFPIDRDEVFDRFVRAIHGLLSGRNRIVEYCLGRWTIRAVLEEPDRAGWKAVAWSSNLGVLIPWPRSRRVIQNVRAG